MDPVRSRPRLVAVLAVLVLLVGAGGAAAAQRTLFAADSGMIHGCVSKKTGVLRVATACRPGERAISWNERGPAGATGPTGLPGAAGASGLPGATGATGATGAIGGSGPIGPIGPIGPLGPVGPSGPPGPSGAPGSAGPSGPSGAPGTVGSIDELEGTPCRGDIGTLHIAYGPGTAVTFTCVVTPELIRLKVVKAGSSLPVVTGAPGNLDCEAAHETCTGDVLASDTTVLVKAFYPDAWRPLIAADIDEDSDLDLVPQWTGCTPVYNDPDEAWCEVTVPDSLSVHVDFGPFRQFFRQQVDAAVGDRESEVEQCATFYAGLDGIDDPLEFCTGGNRGITEDDPDVDGLADAVEVDTDGVIRVWAAGHRDFYVRTPTWHADDESVTWTTSGTCSDADVDLC